MFVSLRLGSFLRLLAAIALGAVIIGVLLAQPSREQDPADVMPPEVVQTTGNPSVVLPAP